MRARRKLASTGSAQYTAVKALTVRFINTCCRGTGSSKMVRQASVVHASQLLTAMLPCSDVGSIGR
eukprot:12912-Eustigmatos_ZCMA.PRE.1